MPRTEVSKSKGIPTWSESDRPRERLLQSGPQSLTDAEILAILIRIGVRGSSAVELARKILKKFGSLRGVAEAPLAALLDIKGLKGAKAAQLSAAIELSRRVSLPVARSGISLKNTRAAINYLRIRLHGLSEEHFRALLLNRRGVLLEDSLLAVGSVDQAKPAIRSILAKVLQANASAIIVGHNHPSGVAEASGSPRIYGSRVGLYYSLRHHVTD